ncbi:MAG: DUF362 domain-containing protein [Desulfovibrionaceae bacterium]|nr:DUF362 domain-containing protein [Desulfovibrionaceae bacterium]
MQESTVYFTGLRARSERDNKISKVARLIDATGYAGNLDPEDLIAIKIHFGERGNDSYINPRFARVAVDKIRDAGAKPFITDTNTLYKGSRHNSVDHLHTALENGFSFATVNAPLIIGDGLSGAFSKDVAVNGRHFSTVKIAGVMEEADGMFVMSHFKGHQSSGFGGAIKNLAMGCATAQGKKDQHAAKFEVEPQLCVACQACLNSCPTNAISIQKGKAVISPEICIGCGECMTVCPTSAISLNWETELQGFIERMVEYALGAVQGKQRKTAYINFLTDITPDCDCVPWSDAPIVPDIGIAASLDPVALDQACLDMVNQQQGCGDSLLKCGHAAGEDKFKGVWSYTIGEHQLAYAESLGLGSRTYRLVEI